MFGRWEIEKTSRASTYERPKRHGFLKLAADPRRKVLVGAVAVGPGVRLPLPRDGFTTRRVVLVRAGEEWRVAQSVEGASPARTTSWTVRSWKE